MVTIGATGPQGEQGLKGDKGDKGEQGPTGATGPAGADGLSGWERVSAQVGPNRDYTKTATASCPSGKVAVGGGYVITTNDRNVVVPLNYPSKDDEWTVLATDTAATGPYSWYYWGILAYVICVTAPPLSP